MWKRNRANFTSGGKAKFRQAEIPHIEQFVPQLEFHLGANSSLVQFQGVKQNSVAEDVMLKNAALEELEIRKKELARAERVKDFEEKTKKRANQIQKTKRKENDEKVLEKEKWRQRLPVPKNYPRPKPLPKKQKREKVCVVGVDEDKNQNFEILNKKFEQKQNCETLCPEKNPKSNNANRMGLKGQEDIEQPRNPKNLPNFETNSKLSQKPKILKEVENEIEMTSPDLATSNEILGWEDIQDSKAMIRARLRKKYQP